jgi:hypothetical protein
MGYSNRDKRLVNVAPKEKRRVRALRRRADRREVRGEHLRTARRATKRGWWYA